MNLDRAVLAFVGLVISVSVSLGYAVSPYWLLLTAFAGLNLLQSSLAHRRTLCLAGGGEA
jgi:hypothetical protein